MNHLPKQFFSILSKIQKYKNKKVETSSVKLLPKQHPRKLNVTTLSQLNRERAPIPLTTPNQIPIFMQIPPSLEIIPDKPGIKVHMIGPKKVGKSSLIQKLVGQSGVGDHGIFHYQNIEVQLLESPEDEIDAYMIMADINTSAKELYQMTKRLIQHEVFYFKQNQLIQEKKLHLASLEDDPLLDPSDPQLNNFLAQKPKILVISKMDLCRDVEKMKEKISEFEDQCKFEKVFYVSSETEYGLEGLKEWFKDNCVEDKGWEYSEGTKTSKSDQDQIEELFKKVFYSRFYNEIPYQCGIKLKEYCIKSDQSVKIEVEIDVETQIQMQIVIGFKGRNIKVLQNDFKIELIKIFQKKFEVFIKVKKRTEKNIEKANKYIETIVPESEENTQKLIDDLKHFQKNKDPIMLNKILKNSYSNK